MDNKLNDFASVSMHRKSQDYFSIQFPIMPLTLLEI